MSRLKRLQEYSRPFESLGGFSSKNADLKHWRDRATANSYHDSKTGDGPQTTRPGTTDKNHVGGSFMPNVRRSET